MLFVGVYISRREGEGVESNELIFSNRQPLTAEGLAKKKKLVAESAMSR